MNFANRILAFLLSMILIISLAACSKSKEDPEMTAFMSYVQQKAEELGMTAQEYLDAGYITFEEWKNGVPVETTAPAMDLNETLQLLFDAYNGYITADTSNGIVGHAREFNRLLSECYYLAGDEQRDAVAEQIYKNTGRYNKIQECVYSGKAALASFNGSSEVKEAFFYFNTDTDDSKFLFTVVDENDELQFLVLNNDGSVFTPNLSVIKSLNPSYYSPFDVTQSTLLVSVSANDEWLMYEFSMNDPSSTGTEIPFVETVTEYSVWQLSSASLDAFNSREASKAANEKPIYE